MSHRRKRIKHTFAVFFVKFLIWISSWLPRKWIHFVFRSLAILAFSFAKKERTKTISNILIAHPNMSETDAKAMARRVFKNLAVNYADLAKGLSIKTKEHYRRVVDIRGEENIIKALEKGNGVLALGCHLGAFELFGTYCGLHHDAVGVGARLKNEALDKILVDNRTSRGIDYTHRGESSLKLLRALKQGKIAIMLIDQDSDKIKSVFVDFYGKKAATPIGATVLAMKTKASVVPMAMSMRNGKQTLTIKPEVELVITGDEEADIITNTQNFTTALEELIKEAPDQWVWMHERWKTRPKETSS